MSAMVCEFRGIECVNYSVSIDRAVTDIMVFGCFYLVAESDKNGKAKLYARSHCISVFACS